MTPEPLQKLQQLPTTATLHDWQQWLREYGERRWGKDDDENGDRRLLPKLIEEVMEVKTAYYTQSDEEMLAELGDVLVVVLRMIDALGGDAEAVLQDTAKKLMARVEEA